VCAHTVCLFDLTNTTKYLQPPPPAGSPDGFRYRQEELAILGKPAADADVVQSYVDQATGADSPILKYLSRGVIAVRFGEVLFCHGGLNDVNMGWLPPRSAQAQAQAAAAGGEGKSANVDVKPGVAGGEVCEDFMDWIDELNRRCAEEVR
jgi:hypothetical protein